MSTIIISSNYTNPTATSTTISTTISMATSTITSTIINANKTSIPLHLYIISRFNKDEIHPYLAIFLTTVSALAANIGIAFLIPTNSSIGGLIVLFIGVPSQRLLGHLLSFSTGVMLYISYMDLMIHAQVELGDNGFFEANIYVSQWLLCYLWV